MNKHTNKYTNNSLHINWGEEGWWFCNHCQMIARHGCQNRIINYSLQYCVPKAPHMSTRQYSHMNREDVLCISTSERMLAHAFTWSKTIKNIQKWLKRYFFHHAHERLTRGLCRKIKKTTEIVCRSAIESDS